MIKPIKKEYMAVLDRIQKSIPKEWLDNVTRKEMIAPKFAQMVRDMASGKDNPDIDQSKITERDVEKAKAIIDSGQIKELEKMVDVENKEITKQIDEYLDNEIQKATARGELPKGKKFRNLNKKIQWKKSKKS